mmetsp:Transcript_14173/g.23172  ORF Transcript_14173/g.23172 Transcript_14173/m.23172 type:complete len:468 (-) Transcript_14173:1770-3173(-)
MSAVVVTSKVEEDVDASLDSGEIDFSDESRGPPTTSFWVVACACLVKMAGMTIVFTTTNEYCALLGLTSGFWPGFMIGVVPVVGGLSSFGWQRVLFCLGYLKTVYLMSLAGAIGGVLYALAGFANSPALMILGRVMLGVASASNVTFHYLAVAAGKKTRSGYMLKMISMINFGLAVGPFLSALIDVIFGSALGLDESAPIIFNTLSIPGWALTVLYGLLVLVFHFLFEDIPVSEIHRHKYYTQSIAKRDLESNTTKSFGTMVYVALAVVVLNAISTGAGIGGMETRTAEVAISNSTFAKEVGTGFAWSWSTINSGFYLGGVFMSFSLLCVIASKSLKRVPGFQDRHWVFIFYAASTMAAAFLFNYPVDKTANIVFWTIGLIILVGSLTVGKSYLFSMGIKLCPNKHMGPYTSILAFGNALGRGIGPIMATYIGDGYLEASTFSGIFLGLFLFNTILVACFFKKFKVE